MAETIHETPINHLRECPFNPRKTYDQAALAELAESIKTQGVMQPIVARPLPADAQDIWVRHEIVFGHRRYRAAQLAGLETVPVILRPLSAQQAAVAQEHENIHRADVSEMEEADSLARMQRDHGLGADAIATAINKSRSYVYGRLKLAKAAPEVRAAVATQGLPADIAIEVVRHPDHGMQRTALKRLKEYEAQGWPSVRSAQVRVRGMFDKNVDSAPFDPADASLAQRAGPCTTCPQRAGNCPDLQGVLDAGVCTDPGCYGAKLREHNRLELLALGSQGHPVINGEAAAALLPNLHSPAEGYARTTHGQWIGSQHMTYADMREVLQQRGQAVPKATLVAVDKGETIVALFTDAQAEALVAAYTGETAADGEGDGGASTPSTAARGSGGGGQAGPDDATAGWTEAERAVVGGHWMQVKEAVLRNLAGRARTAHDLRAILLREFDQADGFGPISELLGLDSALSAAQAAWEADPTQRDEFSCRAWWEAQLATLPPDTLSTLLLGTALWDLLGYGGRGYSQARAAGKVALAERYGVDVVAAARPIQMDDAGCAGGHTATAGAQADAFAGRRP